MPIDYTNLTPEALANMTDEEFAEVDSSKFNQSTAGDLPVEEPVTVTEEVETPVEESAEVVVEEPTPKPEPEQVIEDNPNGVASEAEQTREGIVVENEVEGSEKKTPEKEPEKKPDEVTAEATPEKLFFDTVTAEFNASGKQYKITDANDVVRLMQMGLNYNQKMAALKPNLKIVRALEDAGITSVDQLGHLLDLHAKKPEAIAKLVQDSGIDTFELEDKANGYVPSQLTVDDARIEFEMVADELSSRPAFAKLIQDFKNFDKESSETLYKNPGLMRILTQHIENGQYDQIRQQYDIAQATGKLGNASFLQAYDAIGQALFAAQPAPVAQPVVNTPQVVPTPVPVPVATKTNTVNNTARKAAAPVNNTTPATQKTTLTPEDLWNMSEAEFRKIDPKFLK